MILTIEEWDDAHTKWGFPVGEYLISDLSSFGVQSETMRHRDKEWKKQEFSLTGGLISWPDGFKEWDPRIKFDSMGRWTPMDGDDPGYTVIG